MRAKNITNRHSIKGKNVESVHRYGNTVGVNFADGSTKRYHANSIVFVQPQRDRDGKFLPREYVLMIAVDGVDVVLSVTGRKAARNLKRWMQELSDNVPSVVAL